MSDHELLSLSLFLSLFLGYILVRACVVMFNGGSSRKLVHDLYGVIRLGVLWHRRRRDTFDRPRFFSPLASRKDQFFFLLISFGLQEDTNLMRDWTSRECVINVPASLIILRRAGAYATTYKKKITLSSRTLNTLSKIIIILCFFFFSMKRSSRVQDLYERYQWNIFRINAWCAWNAHEYITLLLWWIEHSYISI